MKKFTVQFNADIEVEADSRVEAVAKAEEELRDCRADEVCYLQDVVDENGEEV